MERADLGISLRQRSKRRSRNDNDPRNFICGCGLSYLSSHALYNHIKIKHTGEVPDGTIPNTKDSLATNLPSNFSYEPTVEKPLEPVSYYGLPDLLSSRTTEQSPSQSPFRSVEKISAYKQSQRVTRFGAALDEFMVSISKTFELYALRVLSLFAEHLKNFAAVQIDGGLLSKYEDGGFKEEEITYLLAEFVEKDLPKNCPVIDTSSARLMSDYLTRWFKWKDMVGGS